MAISTWDHYTDKRIDNLYPEIREQVARFINHMEQNRGIQLRVTSTLRTFAEQDDLYAIGRTRKTDWSPVTHARAGESYHNYGLAFDVVQIDARKQPVWDSPFWDEIGKQGEVYGFEWGGRWSRPDRPHFQTTFGYSTRDLMAMKEAGSKHDSDGRFVNIPLAIPMHAPEPDPGPALESGSLNRLISEDLEALIDRAEYNRISDSTTTICTLRLHCGFIVVGESACMNPNDFDADTGADIAYENAFQQLWKLEGYHRLRAGS